MSSACQDNSYQIKENSSVTIAIQKNFSNGSQLIYGPSTAAPNPQDGVTWVFFPKWPLNHQNAQNATADIWVGFSNNAFYRKGFAKTPDTSLGSSSTCNTNNCNNSFYSTTNGFQNEQDPNSCQGFTRKVAGPACSSTTEANTIATLVFNSCLADTVPSDATIPGNVIYLNLNNNYCYHASNNTAGGSNTNKGLTLVFPECTCGCTNIILSSTDRLVVDAYRKAGFSHPASSEATTPVQNINHLFTQMNKYINQNKAVNSSNVNYTCANTFSTSVCDNSSSCSRSSNQYNSSVVNMPVSCSMSLNQARKCNCQSCSPF